LNEILVSHRVDRKVNGALHKESNYGLIQDPAGSGEWVAVLRKPLHALTRSEIEKGLIVNPDIRDIVNNALAAGTGDPGKDFADPRRHPRMTTRNGEPRHPIHRVRVLQSGSTMEIGNDPRRHVYPGENHHLATYSAKDKNGNPTWRTEIVPVIEAVRRKRRSEPIIRREDHQGNPLIFSLCKGDTVELEVNERTVLCVLKKLSAGDFLFRPLHDARLAKDASKDQDNKNLRIRSDSKFFASKCRKISISPAGTRRRSSD
jgi:hypothetical protein